MLLPDTESDSIACRAVHDLAGQGQAGARGDVSGPASIAQMNRKLTFFVRSEKYFKWGVVAVVFMFVNCLFGLKWLRRRYAQSPPPALPLVLTLFSLSSQVLRGLPPPPRRRCRAHSSRLMVPPPYHARLGLRRSRHLGRRARLPRLPSRRFGRWRPLLPSRTSRQGANGSAG